VQQVREIVQAAKKDGVKFILLLSILGADTRTNTMTHQFGQIEDIVEQSDIQCSILRTNFFMENILLQSQPLSRNELVLPIEYGKVNFVAMEDVALAVSKMLQEPKKFAGKMFDLNGKEAWSGHDLARHLSQALDKDIQFRSCSNEEYVKMLTEASVPKWLAWAMTHYLESVDNFDDLMHIDSSEFFWKLTGQDQLTFKDWIEESFDVLSMMVKSSRQSKQTGRRDRTSHFSDAQDSDNLRSSTWNC